MFRDFLEKLQNLDEPAKKRWLIALSTICALIIFVIWAKYFAFITRPFGNLGQESATGEFSFWETMKTGMSVLWSKFADALRDIGRILGAPRSYLIKP